MVIGICDDDKIWSRRAERIIEEYGERILLETEVFRFADREELFRYEGKPLDVLFMDIVLENEDGITLASEVNQKWTNCRIVYTTNYLCYATEVYDTEHIFYTLKEQFESKIGKIFSKILHEMEQNHKSLIFTASGQSVALAPEEIFYFERQGRKTSIRTVWGNLEIRDKISDLAGRLPETDFLRCHSSYIVYLPNIKRAGKDTFTMKNDDVITISRAYEKTARAAFTRWMSSQLS